MQHSFSSFSDFLKTLQYGKVLRPSRDWFALLGIASLFVLGSILWNMWTFNRIASGEILGVSSEETSHLDTTTFDRVRQQFEQRAASANQYLFEYHFIDPSRI